MSEKENISAADELFHELSSERIRVYDPPAGWRYGFPREYKPMPGESIEQTLLRDGYPQKEIDWGGAEHVRFWESEK